jgi:hypothetical protein
MSLTLGGFAAPRTGLLRGKGGTRQRGDNGVSPPPRTKAHANGLPAAPPRPGSLPIGLSAFQRAKSHVDNRPKPPRAKLHANGLIAPPAPPEPKKPQRRAKPQPNSLQTLRSARARPAALEWEDARLPLLGRLWATAWLPSILLAGCMVALMYLLQTSGVATAGYDIQRLQTERDDWQLRNEQLRLELAKRRSLTWIESEATARLGMVRPEPTALTYLRVAH